MLPLHEGQRLRQIERDGGRRRQRGARGVAEQFGDVDVRHRSVGQATELREALRQCIEALCLSLEDVDGFLQIGAGTLTQS